mmetsp:Transcript_837/g.1789  ORF Transcript_837/g.1789 Transcript_837/m.1789 type:complete len:271 (-) Transcript_837:189-1001(-)
MFWGSGWNIYPGLLGRPKLGPLLHLDAHRDSCDARLPGLLLGRRLGCSVQPCDDIRPELPIQDELAGRLPCHRITICGGHFRRDRRGGLPGCWLRTAGYSAPSSAGLRWTSQQHHRRCARGAHVHLRPRLRGARLQRGDAARSDQQQHQQQQQQQHRCRLLLLILCGDARRRGGCLAADWSCNTLSRWTAREEESELWACYRFLCCCWWLHWSQDGRRLPEPSDLVRISRGQHRPKRRLDHLPAARHLLLVLLLGVGGRSGCSRDVPHDA